MYDFLCVFPHANASHSLIHYLNQHRLMHVAPYTSLCRSLDDVLAYERHLRPWVGTIGAAAKDYHDPEIVETLLTATKRDTVIQTVRDPVESFVAQTNNAWFVARFEKLVGREEQRQTVEELIADAVTRFITPAAAADAYQTHTFRRHLIVDVDDLKGDKAQGTVEMLWRELCGDADPINRVSNYYKPLGSRAFSKLREFGTLRWTFAEGQSIEIHPVAEGDLWTGNFDARKNRYFAHTEQLLTYPDVNELLPALKLKGSLSACVYPYAWHALHPHVRAALEAGLRPVFEKQMRALNQLFPEAEKAMTFTLDSLTPVQAELLKAGIEDDFRTFLRRHPAAAERWTVTRGFLGL